MNQLPIYKIFVAGFAFVLTHWKKIIEISILPLLLALPLLSLSAEIIELIGIFTKESTVKPENIQVPSNVLVYSLLFLYGYASLSVNMYRLVVFGVQSVSWMSIFKIRQIVGFIGLTFFINLATGVPSLLVNQIWLYLVISFFLIPISLNFINIATDQPLKFKWELNVVTQINLFLLQIILPLLIAIVVNFLISSLELASVISWIVKVIIFYWSSITLALCYQLITKESQSNTSK
ncbi:hypothetical protein [bacterium endosymbiont of Bathymodiolus sp. 5 South]|jgi:hypothetical protein|uniref:hypothetical protein n=1 Tax=bacterium endosymbiont of Bathymodiolus sp. 5 South TaxID=1181670 RepID=UPI0010B4E310|nr:hypothetical protein [bacterium endosymbiont of Bathymodiolus sp. 5 South]CAC9437707.1 hypothetical protein [uncultured Gammaproteobacteria bacterium]CAC9657809.1 hypothetical protein [uncultured Gammaproteobacteria bacterium]SHN89902.1 hypothetical protein BCLUESOX_2455 [bacterium endosymbiont of Bathymodiolus sp. 5 South]SSC07960.1 hypothetical protein BTURTLESOX_600 [bacterium endosymbiont of Bathymodiolus sp. 5 South]VVH57214.1 hypothetical protein BSPCLSOX_968 [uncultured Gammaproteoba